MFCPRRVECCAAVISTGLGASAVGAPMSANALRTVWSLFALFAVTVAVLGFLRVAGVHTGGEGTATESLGIFKYAPSEVPGIALPLQIVLLGTVLMLTRTWTRQLGAQSWATRFPVFYFSSQDVDSASPGGARYQLCALIIFLFLPLVLLLIMMMSYLQGTIYFSPSGPAETVSTHISGWSHFNTPRIYRSAGGVPGFFRLGTAEGPEYIPWLTWVYAVLIALEIVYFARVVLWGLFGGHVPATNPWVSRVGY